MLSQEIIFWSKVWGTTMFVWCFPKLTVNVIVIHYLNSVDVFQLGPKTPYNMFSSVQFYLLS